MATIKEKALGFIPKQTKNIADLPEVSTGLTIYDDGAGVDDEGKEFSYSYINVNNENYRVPNSVIGQIQDLLEDNPNLTRFKVKKSGEGLKTRYTVIPLQ